MCLPPAKKKRRRRGGNNVNVTNFFETSLNIVLFHIFIENVFIYLFDFKVFVESVIS